MSGKMMSNLEDGDSGRWATLYDVLLCHEALKWNNRGPVQLNCAKEGFEKVDHLPGQG
jgi:hypothetical protein